MWDNLKLGEEIMRVVVCPGSFDPITNGHIDIIERACQLFDKVVVGVAVNPEKHPLFSIEERLKFVRNAFKGKSKVLVEAYDTLLVDFANRFGAKVIMRGLRAVSDFEREFQIAQLNKKLDPTIETLFMMTNYKYAYLSSSAVKEIAQYKGCVKGLVPLDVEERLYEIYGK